MEPVGLIDQSVQTAWARSWDDCQFVGDKADGSFQGVPLFSALPRPWLRWYVFLSLSWILVWDEGECVLMMYVPGHVHTDIKPLYPFRGPLRRRGIWLCSGMEFLHL